MICESCILQIDNVDKFIINNESVTKKGIVCTNMI